MPQVVHVGCGPKDIRGLPEPFQDGTWREIRFDINPDVKPDVIGTMTDMAAVKTASVDAIFSSHNVEHLYPHEVPVALKEFRRVLGPDGFVLINCPDLQSISALVAKGHLNEPAYFTGVGPISALDMIFGHQSAMAEGNLFMAHRTGFTMVTLAKAIVAAGFARVAAARRPNDFDLWAIGTVAPLSEEASQAMLTHYIPKEPAIKRR